MKKVLFLTSALFQTEIGYFVLPPNSDIEKIMFCRVKLGLSL